MIVPDSNALATLSIPEIDEINERASRVSNLLKRSAELWLEISKEVFDAKRSLRQHAYERFLTSTGITKSVADKLNKIANCSLLHSNTTQQYTNKLEGWTTLYEVAKLPNSKIKELFNAVDQDPNFVITRQSIKQFTSRPTHKDPMDIIAQIRVSRSDVKRLSYELFQKLNADLDEIERIVDRSSPAISIVLKTKTLQHLGTLLLSQDVTDEITNDNETKRQLHYV